MPLHPQRTQPSVDVNGSAPPWRPEVGGLASDLWMDGKEVADSPRAQLKKLVAAAGAKGMRMKSGVECEFFLLTPDGLTEISPAPVPEPTTLATLIVGLGGTAVARYRKRRTATRP